MAIQNGFGEEQAWHDGMMVFSGRFLSKMHHVALFCQVFSVRTTKLGWLKDTGWLCPDIRNILL